MILQGISPFNKINFKSQQPSSWQEIESKRPEANNIYKKPEFRSNIEDEDKFDNIVKVNDIFDNIVKVNNILYKKPESRSHVEDEDKFGNIIGYKPQQPSSWQEIESERLNTDTKDINNKKY